MVAPLPTHVREYTVLQVADSEWRQSRPTLFVPKISCIGPIR